MTPVEVEFRGPDRSRNSPKSGSPWASKAKLPCECAHPEGASHWGSGRTHVLKICLEENGNRPRGNRLERMLHDCQVLWQEKPWPTQNKSLIAAPGPCRGRNLEVRALEGLAGRQLSNKPRSIRHLKATPNEPALKFVPGAGAGSRSFKAVFPGTNSYAGSSSSASALTVTGLSIQHCDVGSERQPRQQHADSDSDRARAVCADLDCLFAGRQQRQRRAGNRAKEPHFPDLAKVYTGLDLAPFGMTPAWPQSSSQKRFSPPTNAARRRGKPLRRAARSLGQSFSFE